MQMFYIHLSDLGFHKSLHLVFQYERTHYVLLQVYIQVGQFNAAINLRPSSCHSPFHLADRGLVDVGRPQKAIEVE